VRRTLFTIGSTRFYAYPVMLYLGIVGGVIAGARGAAVHGLPAVRAYCAMLLLVLPALVGARLLFAFIHWDLYRNNVRRIFRRSEGGAALYGGFVLAVVVSLPLLAALRVPFFGFWDAAAITLLVGMIPTKYGCYLNGCCCGRASEGRFAQLLPNTKDIWKRRIPSQFLEAVLAALLLGLCLWLWSTNPMPGAVFFLALAGYGVGRRALEATREEIDTAGRFNVNSIISWALAGASAVATTAILLSR